MMPTEYIRAYRAEEQDAGDGPIAFIASTEVPARDGMIIDAEAWDLTNFKRNNLVLWVHDWYGNRPPIGKADVKVDKEARVLRANITFDMADPFAADIRRKYVEGYLNALSVGFDILQLAEESATSGERAAPRVTKAELLEISAVPIPADPHALAERHKRGMADLSDILRSLSDAEPTVAPSEFVWPGVAALMARCYFDTSDDDGEREAQYRRLAREYRTLGKEPPEFLTRSQLTVLDDADIRALFLADEGALLGWEPDGVRAGAVLSSRNYGDLEQAATLIRGVLERATKEEPSEDDVKRSFLSRFYPTSHEPDDLLRRLTG